MMVLMACECDVLWDDAVNLAVVSISHMRHYCMSLRDWCNMHLMSPRNQFCLYTTTEPGSAGQRLSLTVRAVLVGELALPDQSNSTSLRPVSRLPSKYKSYKTLHRAPLSVSLSPPTPRLSEASSAAIHTSPSLLAIPSV